MMEFSHSFDWNNVKILDKKANYFKRSVSEMLHIRDWMASTRKRTWNCSTILTIVFLICSPRSSPTFTALFYFVKRCLTLLNSAVIHYTHPVPYFNTHYTVYNNCLFLFLNHVLTLIMSVLYTTLTL